MYRNKYNKRSFDGSVSGLPRQLSLTRKPIKNKDHIEEWGRQAVGSAASVTNVYQDDAIAGLANCQWVFKPAFGITRGSSNGQRNGNQITVKNLTVDVNIHHSTSMATYTGRTPTRIMVFMDTQNNKSDLGLTNLYDDNALLVGSAALAPTFALRLKDTRKRWIVFYDKLFEEKNLEPMSTATAKCLLHKRFTIPINKNIYFDEDVDAGRYADILKNALYVYVITPKDSLLAAGTTQRNVTIQTRLTYTDA